jgi:hypothetical protein
MRVSAETVRSADGKQAVPLDESEATSALQNVRGLSCHGFKCDANELHTSSYSQWVNTMHNTAATLMH